MDLGACLRAVGARLISPALILVAAAGCTYKPTIDVSREAASGFYGFNSAQIAVLIIPEGDHDFPPCLETTLRRHLPKGPNLHEGALRQKVRGWTKGTSPLVSRARLQDTVVGTEINRADLGPEVPYIALAFSRSEHIVGSGYGDGVGFAVSFHFQHITAFDVGFYELASGKRMQRLKVSAWGKRTYGIFGVLPVFGHSDTADFACQGLDEALAELPD